jgi:hypothetical protein
MVPTTEKSKKHAQARIRWDKIKVTFVPADKQKPNPLNPYSTLSFEERRDGILYLSAKIWKAS